MRRTHFEALHPICPLCRGALAIASSIRENVEDQGDILEGILVCASCAREYPIIDGIPVIVGAIRAWLSANPLQILQRDDLSPKIESLIGDVLGPGSQYDVLRQHISIYASDHYEQGSAVHVIPSESVIPSEVEGSPDSGDPSASSRLRMTRVLDTGCATGGTTFHFAQKTGALTLGIDLNFAMLRIASRVLREGRVRYARRRVGLVYDRRDETIDVPARELVDFWCCDVGALPFADETFALAASVNVIDCTATPRDTVSELARVLRPGGRAILSTPYDWAPTATPFENWVGGHSQRGPHEGAAEPLLRSLLADAFIIEREEEHVPWRIRLHDRSFADYDVHLIVARRRPA